MAKLYDKKGQPVQVPDNQVLEVLASGQYGLPKGEQINMSNPTGEVYQFGVDDALKMAGEGWTFETEQAKRHRQTVEKYGSTTGQEIMSGMLGAARGLTFGLSDVALTELGIATPEAVSGLKEASPGASLGGELVGIAGGLLAGGGAGAGRLGGLLRTAGAPVRGVAKIGAGIERGVGRLVAPLAERGALGRVAARGIEVGAGSAVEGAFYGGGQAISEMALGDMEATAENLLGHVGMGVALGGGFGGALGGGFQGMKELFTVTGRLTKKGAGAMVKLWEKQTGRKALPGLGDAYAGVSEAALGKPGAVKKLMGREEKARAVQELSKRDDAARGMSKLDDEIRATSDEVREATTGRQKQEYFRKIAKEGNADLATQSADDMLGAGLPVKRDDVGVILQGEGMISELDEAVLLSAKTEGELGFRGYWKDLQAASKRTKKIINKAQGKADYTGRVHGALDDLKRDIGHIRYKKMARRSGPSGSELRAMDKADDLYKRLQKTLEEDKIWGKAAADTQRQYNKRWVAYLEDIKRRPDHHFHESFKTTDGKVKVQSRPHGFRKYIDDMGGTRNDLDKPWYFKQAETRQELMDEAIKLYDLPPATVAKIEKARGSLKKLRAMHDDMKKTVGLQNQLGDLEAATRQSGFSTEMGAVGGFLVGGPVGAAIGGGIGAVLNPARTIRQLATLERLATGYRERISAAVKGYVSKFKKFKPGKGARRFIAPASVNYMMDMSFNGGKKKSKNRVEAFKQRMGELEAFAAGGAYGNRRLAESTETVGEVAPQLAQAVNMTAMKAAEFLMSVAPRNPGTPSFFGKEWQPSELMLSKFERYVAIVDNPRLFIKELENGNLTHEAVEAMRAVYPKTYEQVVSELMGNVEEIRETLPYEHRLQLSILFKVPIEETTRPDFVASMQASQLKPQIQQRPQPGAHKASVTDPSKHMTAAQRLSAKQRTS